jgi:TetR/AcrR family transcriptional regulator, lmrAB and yxaGH operons repressor
MHYDECHSQETMTTNDTRETMIRCAAALIGTKGVAGASFTDVLAESGAPRGSIYHYFPDGKRQLTEGAVRWTSEQILGYLATGPVDSPRAVLEHFVDLWRRAVIASDGATGCAVAGVAIDTGTDEPLMTTVREAFRSWIEALAGRLRSAGLEEERAASTASLTVAAMEGALILCRAERRVEPLEAVARELDRLVS